MSRRKDRLSWALIASFLIVVGLAAYYVLWPLLQPHVIVRLGDGLFSAQLITADATAKNTAHQGAELAENKAILRVYHHDALWPIDMAKRQAAFDIVWLNKDKQVIYIVKDASADSTSGTIFTPSSEARYMLELPNGTVEIKNIGIDDEAVFDENNLQGLVL